MKTAFVLGGTGFVGRHVARRLAQAGWNVAIGSRGASPLPEEVEGLPHVALDRSEDASLRRALGAGVDVLVDVIPYEISDAQQIRSLSDMTGSIVAISTASVYADDAGRTLDEARSADESPTMPVPIRETQPRTHPSSDTYSTKKVGIEDILLEQDDLPATVIRPCAIYGPGARHCREWFFVKRVLDRRRRVILAYEGQSIFHTTAVENLAELVRLAAEQPGTRALNCGDPDPPTVQKIAAAIAAALGHGWEEVLVPSGASEQEFLGNPWGVPTPWILDMTAAQRELDYVPATTYEQAIGGTVESIARKVSERGESTFANAIPYLPRPFDYEAEDAFGRSPT